MSGWESVTFNFDNKAATVSSLEMDPLPNYSGILSLTMSSLDSYILSGSPYYFKSSPSYSGSRLRSYGGYIKFNFTFSGNMEQGNSSMFLQIKCCGRGM